MADEEHACEHCKVKAAKVLCQCDKPPVLLCYDCIGVHMASDPTLAHISLPIHIPVKTSQETFAYIETINTVDAFKQHLMTLQKRLYYELEMVQSRQETIRNEIDSRLQAIFGQQREALTAKIGMYEEELAGFLEEFEAIKANPQAVSDMSCQAARWMRKISTTEEELSRSLKIRAVHNDNTEQILAQLDLIYTPDIALELERANTQLAFLPSPADKISLFDCLNKTGREIQVEMSEQYMGGSAWAIIDDSRLFFTGGLFEDYWSRAAFTYHLGPDTRPPTVELHSSMITARGFHSICQFGGQLYVFGGSVPSTLEYYTGIHMDSSGLDECEVYDQAQNVWASISPLPQALSYITSAASPTALYIAGYQSQILYRYDPRTKFFTSLNYEAKTQTYKQLAFTDNQLVLLEQSSVIVLSEEGTASKQFTLEESVTWTNMAVVVLSGLCYYFDFKGSIVFVDLLGES